MRYLSVCSGIEAATVAWHRLGWTPAGFSEIEPFPRAVLEQRHGAVAVNWDHRHSTRSNITPLFGDFTKIETHHVGPVDLLVGGTPCQSFSIAGKRLGLDDPRGNLTLEYLALARCLRPRWLVWENVPGVLSNDSGRTMGAILGIMGELGYRWAYRVLDAQFVRVDGFGRAVPQRRRRVFVVGHLGNDARAAAVLFDPESLRGDIAPRREAGEGFAADIAPSLVSSGRGCERAGDTRGQDPVIAVAFGGNNIAGPIDVATARNAHGGPVGRLDFESETFVAVPIAFRTSPNCGAWETGDRIDALTTGIDPTSHIVAVPFDTTQITSPGNYSAPAAGHPCHPLASTAHAPSIAIQERAVSENPDAGPQGKGWQEGIAYTLEARHHVQAVAQTGWAVRRLTPRECERLQGFPEDQTAIRWRGKEAPDGPRYKAIGNSMAVNVMRWIGTRIDLVERAIAVGDT